MKILCLSYEYPPIGGGGSPVCAGVAEALAGAGHSVDVVTSAMADLKREETVNDVAIHRVPCWRRRPHMADSLELASTLVPIYRRAMRLIQQQRYDLIHCHFILPTGIVAQRLSAVTGLPYVLTAHGSDVPGYNPDRFQFMHHLLRPWWRRVVNSAVAITSPSRFLASLINSHTDRHIDIVPNGLSLPARTSAPRINRILLASRLFERKGVQDVLHALDGADQSWRVEVAGDGPYLPTLRRIARQCGLNVHFRGFVPRGKLTRLYQTSKIFVFPSRCENFPVVLLEAMSAGCAVIAANAPGSCEVVGEAALGVEPGNIGMMRRSLNWLMHDEAEIERLRELAYERVTRFAWPRIAQEYEGVFDRVRPDLRPVGGVRSTQPAPSIQPAAPREKVRV